MGKSILLLIIFSSCILYGFSQEDRSKHAYLVKKQRNYHRASYDDYEKDCGGVEALEKIKFQIEFEKGDHIDKAEQNINFRNKIEKLENMVKATFIDLPAMKAKCYPWVTGGNVSKNGPGLYCHFFCYACDNNKKFVLADETGNSLQIRSNELGFFAHPVSKLDINNSGTPVNIFKLPRPEFKWHDVEAYVITDYAIDVLVTRPSQLPYRVISRKEYLNGAKKHLQELIKNEAVSELYKMSLNNIEEYLQQASEEELAKQAILDPSDNDISFFQKFGYPASGIRLAIINPDYFKKLPDYTPQLFAIRLTYLDDFPFSEKFKDLFLDNFPLTELQSMIDH